MSSFIVCIKSRWQIQWPSHKISSTVYIIEAVGDDSLLLKRCALVSSSFLLPSRKHLFSKISLKLGLTGDPACQRLHQLLVEHPVIQSFVKRIAINSDWDYHKTVDSDLQLNRPSLIAILRLSFCCLESFSINMVYPSALNWNECSSELKDALSTIICSSTLKTLRLARVNVPMMLFHGIHLTKLELSSLAPNFFDDKQSRLLMQAASHTVIDWCVWNCYGPVDGPTEPIFLPFMCHLRVFEIYIHPDPATVTLLMCSLHISLTSPATLEHIKVNFTCDSNGNLIYDDELLDDLRDADVWRPLDSIITHPTGSQLQRVDINIIFRYEYATELDEAGVKQLVLDALPLLCEKGILFVKVTMGWMTWF